MSLDPDLRMVHLILWRLEGVVPPSPTEFFRDAPLVR